MKLLKIFELKDKEAQNLEFSFNFELFDITKGQSTITTISPYTLNMITKDPKWALRASLIKRATCEISEVSYNFENTPLYLQLFFCDIKNLSELKKWYFMQQDEFLKNISLNIIAPLEKEAFLVLRWMAHIISSWNFPKNLFVESREDVLLLLAKFLMINRVKSVRNSLDSFLLSILEQRITELLYYDRLSADWINSSCTLFNRSYLRAHLSAIVIAMSCFQLRIVDLYFLNSCLASHAAYMEAVSEGISTRKLRNIANEAFLAAIPQDTLTFPEKYLAPISSFINHAST